MPRKPPCPEFGRLPKAMGPLKALNFKRVTPGSIAPIAAGLIFRANEPLRGILNPRHPSARMTKADFNRKLPFASHKDILSLRMLPKALLQIPTNVFSDPPFSYNADSPPGKLKTSFVQIISIKGIHKSAVIRSTIRRRVQTALSMITTRGADAKLDKKGREEIVFNESDAGPHWIFTDWTYVAVPSLEIYRMPYTQLIPILRQLLMKVNSTAAFLERSWKSQETSPSPFSRPPPKAAKPENAYSKREAGNQVPGKQTGKRSTRPSTVKSSRDF